MISKVQLSLDVFRLQKHIFLFPTAPSRPKITGISRKAHMIRNSMVNFRRNFLLILLLFWIRITNPNTYICSVSVNKTQSTSCSSLVTFTNTFVDPLTGEDIINIDLIVSKDAGDHYHDYDHYNFIDWTSRSTRERVATAIWTLFMMVPKKALYCIILAMSMMPFYAYLVYRLVYVTDKHNYDKQECIDARMMMMVADHKKQRKMNRRRHTE